jgi:uncharacterized SAM-binding protein YcdF (DUF218 family)
LLLLAAALRWRRRILVALPIAILWIFSAPVVADALLRSLEDRYPWRPDSAYPEADAVFALGGGILGPRDRAGVEMDRGENADRFERALSLFTSGRAHILVLSAEGPPRPGLPSAGDRLREIAIHRGVPAESILVTPIVRNTASEESALASFAVRFHWKRVLLVTSAAHMPRAMLLFRHCPAEVIPVTVAFQSSAPRQPSDDSALARYLPQAEALAQSERALREYLGIMFYSVSRH